MRILLIKTSSLGDVIHNLPVVNDILQYHPHAIIDWVVEESFADIPKLHPNVNQVIPLAIRRWRKRLFKPDTWREIQQFTRQLRSQHYDVIIDTQGLIKSGCIAMLAHGVKHGFDQHSIRERLASRCYQHSYNISYQQHAVVRNRTLVAKSLNFPTPDSAPDYGLAPQAPKPKLNEVLTLKTTIAPTQPQPFAMALHGTSRDSKLWPEEQWIQLGKALEQTGLALVMPWASQAELARAQRIAAQLSLATVLPKLSIQELAAIIHQAKIAIGVDTGLSHLAAALNVPTVAIYTDTNPALTGVMQGASAPAVNLGGIAQTPDYREVLAVLRQISKIEQ